MKVAELLVEWGYHAENGSKYLGTVSQGKRGRTSSSGLEDQVAESSGDGEEGRRNLNCFWSSLLQVKFSSTKCTL